MINANYRGKLNDREGQTDSKPAENYYFIWTLKMRSMLPKFQ